ncbi:MAG: 2'-deoxycytidine 5'-triphosphate deaminase [Salinisphaera sp.]|nr:2'-deoxycytidine 5'-triphosphate deaminase [Salinisphaera sp.]
MVKAAASIPRPENYVAPLSGGILPCQALTRMIHETGELRADEPITEEQVQPASLDLRLGRMAYRVRASFLPGPDHRVADKLGEYGMHEMDISRGAVLERGCVYIVPLQESLALAADTSAAGNPKSSTGRLDVFTRLICDYGEEFDRVRRGYHGPLYAEIAPRTFSVLVRKGSRVSQLRLRRNAWPQPRTGLEDERSGVRVIPLSVDIQGDCDSSLVGYRAKAHAGLIDIDRCNHYPIDAFWEPVRAMGGQGLVLDPGEFYILASKEAVAIPSDQAAEMVAYDTLVGEFRVHYAGFFDPGFGHPDAGGQGARAVLEVRSYEVPFVLNHGQTVGRLIYEPLTATPDKLYGGAKLASSYQRQGLALSKHFFQADDHRLR